MPISHCFYHLNMYSRIWATLYNDEHATHARWHLEHWVSLAGASLIMHICHYLSMHYAICNNFTFCVHPDLGPSKSYALSWLCIMSICIIGMSTVVVCHNMVRRPSHCQCIQAGDIHHMLIFCLSLSQRWFEILKYHTWLYLFNALHSLLVIPW